jgi:hypothetical protein
VCLKIYWNAWWYAYRNKGLRMYNFAADGLILQMGASHGHVLYAISFSRLLFRGWCKISGAKLGIYLSFVLTDRNNSTWLLEINCGIWWLAYLGLNLVSTSVPIVQCQKRSSR